MSLAMVLVNRMKIMAIIVASFWLCNMIYRVESTTLRALQESQISTGLEWIRPIYSMHQKWKRRPWFSVAWRPDRIPYLGKNLHNSSWVPYKGTSGLFTHNKCRRLHIITSCWGEYRNKLINFLCWIPNTSSDHSPSLKITLGSEQNHNPYVEAKI